MMPSLIELCCIVIVAYLLKQYQAQAEWGRIQLIFGISLVSSPGSESGLLAVLDPLPSILGLDLAGLLVDGEGG